jgi:lipase
VRLHTVEWGDEDAPPLVCAHGVTSHALRFRRMAERLADRFRVIAVDLRGHGRSDWEPPWDLDTHVDDLLETADALRVEQADWMGHSFGGRLALELAARAPDRVRRLVLLDPAVWVPPPRALELAEEMRADESFRSVEQAVDARIAGGSAPLTARETLDDEFPEHLERSNDGRLRFRYSRAAVIAAYGEMAKAPPLGRVTAPALLIRGEETWVLPPELVATTRDLYAGDLETLDVPGGHILMWDALEETLAAVERFLTET